MREISKATIVMWKKPGAIIPKIDYSVSTKYYRAVTNKGEKLGASVDPREVLKLMTGKRTAKLIEVKL